MKEVEDNYQKFLENDKYIYFPYLLTEKKEWRDFGIFVHIYNINLWEEIYSFIQNLKGVYFNIDLYVNIAAVDENIFQTFVYKEIEEKINKTNMFKNIYITHSNNYGMDIGGFITSYCKMLNMGVRYNQLIKIHTKTNKNWRYQLLYGLLGNKIIIKNNLKLMRDSNVGMIGSMIMKNDNKIDANKKSFTFLDGYLDYYNINKNSDLGYFVPGTIFGQKGEIFDNFFKKNMLLEWYSEFKPNYCGNLNNNIEGKPHAFERLFGILVHNYGKKVITFDTKV